MHDRLQALIEPAGARIDAFVCPHNAGECDCRKPGIGLFARRWTAFPPSTSAAR